MWRCFIVLHLFWVFSWFSLYHKIKLTQCPGFVETQIPTHFQTLKNKNLFYQILGGYRLRHLTWKSTKPSTLWYPDSRRNVKWNSCQKDKWKGLLTYCPNCQFCNNYQNLKLRFDFSCCNKKPKKFCMILGSKRNWENILYQMEQRNNEIIESVLDMKAAMADTCSKIHTLSL